MTISNHAAAAKAIRTELKKNGIKATVRASSYSMGSSININVCDELPATIEAIKSFADKYQHGDFDGMTDSYNYRADNGLPTVSFIFVNNDHSDELTQQAWDHLRGIMAGFEDAPTDAKDAWSFYSEQGCGGSEWLNRVLGGHDFPEFNRARKQRVAAPLLN